MRISGGGGPGGCRRVNPYKERSLDGMNLNPLEVMFVKVKAHLLYMDAASATAAGTLDRWMRNQVRWRCHRK